MKNILFGSQTKYATLELPQASVSKRAKWEANDMKMVFYFRAHETYFHKKGLICT